MGLTNTEALIDTDEHWKEASKQEQIQFAEFFNVMDVCTFSILKDRLAVSCFGIPEQFKEYRTTLSSNDYTEKQQKFVEKLATCILENQKNPNELKIYMSFVLVLGRKDGEKKKNFQDWVFKIPGNGPNKKIFIDRYCRVYINWKDYLTENTLPPAQICYPHNGEYSYKNQTLDVEFSATPASSVGKKVLFGFDVASCVTGFVAGGVTTASLFVPIAAPLVWGAFATSFVAGSYGAGRSIECLVNRDKHRQTLSFLNSQARSAWLGATVPFLGMAAGGASAFAATAPRLGLSVTQVARTAVNVTNGVNCFAHGVCFAHDIYGIIECKLNGDRITTTQVFQCIGSALLFANAVISTHQARMLLQALAIQNENIYTKIAQPTITENGMSVRPTNFAVNANIAQTIFILVEWGSLMLRVPPNICGSILEIIHFIQNKTMEKDVSFAAFICGLIPLLKILCENICHHMQNKPVFPQINEMNRPPNGKMFEETCSKEVIKNLKFKGNSCNNLEDTKIFDSRTQLHPLSTNVNAKEATINDDQANNEITIIDVEWTEQNAEVQEAIAKIINTDKVSALEILQITHFFFDRLKRDVAEKEKQFQNSLGVSNLTEENMENIYGIEGDRTQFFANNIVKSYSDFKLLAIKQDYEKLIEKEGLRMPLYCPPESAIQIQYFTCTQTEGDYKEKYLKILQQTGVAVDKPSCTFYYCANSCFVNFKAPNSKYAMVGVVNCAEGNSMSGIIIIEKRT